MGAPRATVAWHTTDELAGSLDPDGYPDLELTGKDGQAGAAVVTSR